ncbi:small conductance mechanosensitive channel [Catalinimonas alkaloidigena]|uniref:mechanosensitive ion channel family protein n=1 Tax=Catalinimonas alkaloidigena TaxID=1075417 RepID=UPI0024061BCF|nr:mechanosensitive ion channel family protein [Catalinimonas alkaloidigena]MDF9796202.1 small conductance mechanosensitive channel [Catalinimonas alkaloidigena]
MDFDIENPLELVTDKLESWLSAMIKMLPNLVVAIIIVIVFYLIARLARNGVKKLFQRVSSNYAVNNLFSNIVFIGLFIAGIFIALGILDLTTLVGSLLAGVGIVGLALGFAFQDIAANFISGIIIAFQQPFKVGDIIENDGHMGIVTDVSLRITTIKTFQGLEVLIPNKQLFQNVVTNYTRTNERRVDLGVGVSYGDDLAKVKKVTIDAVSKLDSIDKNRDVTLFFNEFGDSSINFSVRFWAKSPKQPDYLAAQSDAVMAIQHAYNENDIMIPFPIRTLDFGIKGGEKLSEMVLQHSNGNGKH